MPHQPDTATIDQLKRFDALERSLIQCYEAVIAKISDPYVRQQLEECQRSHQMRTDILVEEIEDLGGDCDVNRRDPTFTLIIGADVGEVTMIDRLCALEDLGLAAYRAQLDVVDFDVRDLVEGDLLPEQERTHAIITCLATPPASEIPEGPQG